ncbi:hypothetical protein COEREDRAFT_90174 [Coemansia reversa NRRL 1564]|uniref:Heterokaryon incompatibility domain-containing protein n=1 Tax=Coemansia reversa (strain ATCC 12441 / NRRL 1564) TaxID=763665 RepID=A0A2G5B0M6_COERN|nr:hypothetical protein COEREDRAFT_90174 [Coemansia reversa NRRL 1564]|eukprot:PIA12564.1 hypothetical protein COEREDRAFT_90174 [Coemansia reversa NRRL 1564]
MNDLSLYKHVDEAVMASSEEDHEIYLTHLDSPCFNEHKFDDSCLVINKMSLKEAKQKGYVAISYTWGDEMKWNPLLENGKIGPSIISFNNKSLENIKNIIDRVFFEEKIANPPKYFWIDALCIDQENRREKKFMISIMQHIFKGAKMIIAIPDLGDSSSRMFADVLHFKHMEKNKQNQDSYNICKPYIERWFDRTWVKGEIMASYDSYKAENSDDHGMKIKIIMKYEYEYYKKKIIENIHCPLLVSRINKKLNYADYHDLRYLSSFKLEKDENGNIITDWNTIIKFINTVISTILNSKARDFDDKVRAIVTYTNYPKLFGDLNRFEWCKTNKNIIEEMFLTGDCMETCLGTSNMIRKLFILELILNNNIYEIKHSMYNTSIRRPSFISDKMNTSLSYSDVFSSPRFNVIKKLYIKSLNVLKINGLLTILIKPNYIREIDLHNRQILFYGCNQTMYGIIVKPDPTYCDCWNFVEIDKVETITYSTYKSTKTIVRVNVDITPNEINKFFSPPEKESSSIKII